MRRRSYEGAVAVGCWWCTAKNSDADGAGKGDSGGHRIRSPVGGAM